jgi:YfiH family protein
MAVAPDVIRPDWPAPANVRAAATTRAGGVSAGAWSSLNLATHVGDDPAAVAGNRRRLRAALALPSEPRWLEQVHGTTVALAEADEGTPMADAMIATRPGVVCAVLTADCLPVLFCDESGSRIAAAHAGWRGLAAGVLEATVDALAKGGASPGGLIAWIGPSISGPAYEVGMEVRAAFSAEEQAVGFIPNPLGRWQLDLARLARYRLAAAGVVAVHGGALCTASDPERLFSYRRDGACGRSATLIWLS